MITEILRVVVELAFIAVLVGITYRGMREIIANWISWILPIDESQPGDTRKEGRNSASGSKTSGK